MVSHDAVRERELIRESSSLLPRGEDRLAEILDRKLLVRSFRKLEKCGYRARGGAAEEGVDELLERRALGGGGVDTGGIDVA
jgi:hypothetical protein